MPDKLRKGGFLTPRGIRDVVPRPLYNRPDGYQVGIHMPVLKRKTEGETAKAEEPKAEQASKQRNGAYFVSPHPDGGWQVKKANAQKALKKFKTKAEAEAYAKQVAANQGTSVVRQKKDGKIQKKR